MGIVAGRLLSGRYRLIRPIGVGSQAAVWIAEHLALSNEVAVKLIDPALARKDDMRERFRREATAAAQLRSAHVVQILDHGIDGDQPFIVMELLEGEDLYDRLHHRGRLTLYETSKIVTQVARALTRAHAAGIVHRDLKPENVFLVQNDDDEIVKVLDFGIAKITTTGPAGGEPRPAKPRTELGELLGTPHYMSPEQIKGLAEIDHRADLWALGVIAYQCATGELPFDSEGIGDLLIKIAVAEPPVPSQVMPDLTPAFDAWFDRSCARDAAHRFQSAREMADALARAVGISPELLRGPPSAPRSDLESDGPTSRLAASIARAAKPVVLVNDLPPDSAPRSSRRVQAEPEPQDPIGRERPSTVPPEPMLLVRKRPEQAPESRTGADATSSASAPPTPRTAIVLVGPEDDPVPPRSSPPRLRGAPATPAPPRLDLAPPARAEPPRAPEARRSQPRIAPPPRSTPRLAATPEAAPAPRSPPSYRDDFGGAIDPGRARTGTTSGVTSPMTEPPPPELDGSRRQRAGRVLGLAVLAGAVALAIVVIRSQLIAGADPSPSPGAAPQPPATPTTATSIATAEPPPPAASASPPPVVGASDATDAGIRAIDPGARVERDAGRPAPWPTATPYGASSGRWNKPRPGKAKPAAGGDDLVIDVPDVAE